MAKCRYDTICWDKFYLVQFTDKDCEWAVVRSVV